MKSISSQSFGAELRLPSPLIFFFFFFVGKDRVNHEAKVRWMQFIKEVLCHSLKEPINVLLFTRTQRYVNAR